MPAAIDHHITFAVALNDTDTFRCYAADFDEAVSFSVEELTPGDGWVNYLMGVVDGLRRLGIPVKGRRLCVWKYDTGGGRTLFFGGTLLWIRVCDQ